MDTTPCSSEAPLLELIRGALNTKTDAGDPVALKALHSGAIALSKQRRALRRKAAASPARADAGHSNSAVSPAFSSPQESRAVTSGVPEILQAEVREMQQEDLEDFKAPFAAEAKQLGRAHRSMCSRGKAVRGKPRGPASDDAGRASDAAGPASDAAPTFDLAQESTAEVCAEQPVAVPTVNVNVCSVCGQTCPVCGGPDPLRPASALRTDEEQVLAARLEMAETLLARAAPEAARAVALERELAAERARSADLAEALKGTRWLACALHDGLEETTRQFELFMAKVRLTAEAADETIGEVKGAAEALRRLDFQPPPPQCGDQEALLASLRRDDGRVHELTSRVQRLHSELHVEKENAHQHRQMVSRVSNAELSLQQQLQLEAVAARHEMQEQLQEEHTRAQRYRRQSSLLDLTVQQSEAEVDAVFRQLQESRLELQQSRHEERENEAFSRRRLYELQHMRDELSASEQELSAAAETASNLRVSVRQHQRHAGARQAALVNEVQNAVAVLHGESTLQMLGDPRPHSRSRLAWRSQRGADGSHWQTVTVRVSTAAQVPTLHWKTHVRSHFSRPKTGSLNLQDVVSVNYGEGLRLSAAPPAKPWNSFALRSQSHTYSFWSSDDAITEAFIVGLSRLCPRAPPVCGRDFRMHRTLTRVGETREARAEALLAAVRGAAPEPTPAIYVSDPDGAMQVISPGRGQAASSSAGHQQAGEPSGGAEAFSPVSFGVSAQPASSSSGQQQAVFGADAQGNSTASASHFQFAQAIGSGNRSLDEDAAGGHEAGGHEAGGHNDADGESAGEVADPEDQDGVPAAAPGNFEYLEGEEGEEEYDEAEQWYEESQSSTRSGSTRSESSYPHDASATE